MRNWKSSTPDDGSVHSLGNGQILAYAQGPDWIQVFGPPYSSPTQLALTLLTDGCEVSSSRESGCAIWTHAISQAGAPAGSFRDFCDSDLACLVRAFSLDRPLSFLLNPAPGVRIIPVPEEFGAGFLCETPPGTFFYHIYPIPRPLYSRLIFLGPIATDLLPDGTVEITCPPGPSALLVCGGPSYPEAVQTAASACATPLQHMLERTRNSWHAYSAAHQRVAAAVPLHQPARETLLQAIDDAAILVKTQQDASGAIMAGHNYHMGYVRDQYGDSRGLLALGQIESARQILEFYWQIWQRHGIIHNAHAARVDGAFHIHEFDSAEITGYLIQQAFDLQAVTTDLDFTRRIFPMLTWAFEVQVSILVDHMLPFNGDETYIAGGILPRTTINDGSAEATLLFIESGLKLVDFALTCGLWSASRIEEANGCLHQVADRFRRNFMPKGVLLTNNPARSAATPLPAFRHGVCERCHAEGRSRGIEWTAKNRNGRYLCPSCLNLGNYPAAAPTVFELQSVSLAPIYMRSQLISLEELSSPIIKLAAQYQASGLLPSRPEDPSGLTVGYDYGLFLFALTALKHPLAAEIFQLTLDRRDSTGAWVEYYRAGQPIATRCRPWETSINIEALLYAAGIPTTSPSHGKEPL